MNKILLEISINNGLTTYEIADEFNMSQTNVRYWLKKFGLKTLTEKAIDWKSKITSDNGFPCNKCKNIKPLTEDFFYFSKIGEPYPWCKDCRTLQVFNRQKENKQIYVNYKGGQCNICGYCKCLGALEFHHLDPSKKDFQISRSIKPLEELKIELDKCLLLCANCHRELHHKEIFDKKFSKPS